MADRRDRWRPARVDLAGFKAQRLAPAPNGGVWALDRVAGRIGELETQFAKALSAGTNIGSIMSAVLRQLGQLHRARLSLESGQSIEQALGGFIPPVHFRRREPVETALKSWTAARLERAMSQFADAALEVRRNYALSVSLGHRALLLLAQAARRKG